VSGILTLTSEFFIFEPDLADPFVHKNGVLPYQLYISMADIFDVQIIRENEKYYYDTSLEISVLKDDSVRMFDFIMDEKRYYYYHYLTDLIGCGFAIRRFWGGLLLTRKKLLKWTLKLRRLCRLLIILMTLNESLPWALYCLGCYSHPFC
jgi:hypothetical protein